MDRSEELKFDINNFSPFRSPLFREIFYAPRPTGRIEIVIRTLAGYDREPILRALNGPERDIIIKTRKWYRFRMTKKVKNL